MLEALLSWNLTGEQVYIQLLHLCVLLLVFTVFTIVEHGFLVVCSVAMYLILMLKMLIRFFSSS